MGHFVATGANFEFVKSFKSYSGFEKYQKTIEKVYIFINQKRDLIVKCEKCAPTILWNNTIAESKNTLPNELNTI